MPLRLIIEDDEGTTTIVPLTADAITIGRQQGNTIQLTEKNVSRRHARLFPDNDGWVIEDLNSYNGIKVNGQLAEGRIALSEGDVIQIGDYHLALTEDVDKRTLNYDARDAANNDPAAPDPLLASSSSDLPQLSPDELAALSSGPQTPQPAAMLMDSGPVPAAVLPPSYADEPQRRGGAGMVVGVLAAMVVISAGLYFFVLRDVDDTPPIDKRITTTADAGSSSKVGVPVRGQPLPADPPGSPEDPPVDAAGEELDGDDPPPAEVEGEGEDGEVDDSAGEVDDSAGLEAVEDPTAGASRRKKPGGKRKPPKTKPEPPEPPQPTPDPEELLAQARKAVYQQPARAYALARQSNSIKRQQPAVAVMVTAACRIPDAAKARAAFKLLKVGRDTMVTACKRQGIDLNGV